MKQPAWVYLMASLPFSSMQEVHSPIFLNMLRRDLLYFHSLCLSRGKTILKYFWNFPMV